MIASYHPIVICTHDCAGFSDIPWWGFVLWAAVVIFACWSDPSGER